jgi:hypothetical protein
MMRALDMLEAAITAKTPVDEFLPYDLIQGGMSGRYAE